MNRTTCPTKLAILTITALFFLTGCLPMDGNQGSSDNGHAPAKTASTAKSAEPYNPADFRDLLIPGDLDWQRDKSVSINTDSFTGGVLNFTGRVEVNSLTEFFMNAMKKDGWTAVGSLKAENVLLAFVKEKSSCLIKIDERGPLGKTEVNIYITHKNS